MRIFTVSLVILIVLVLGGILLFRFGQMGQVEEQVSSQLQDIKEAVLPESPLSIKGMREKEYPGSDLIIEETLSPGSNYQRFLVSYRSDGLKINGLLTVPNGTPPENGWPAIVFNHGYIPPDVYRPTERYIAYTDAFSRSGYVLLRPDYRGHADSEGSPEGAYFSPGYTIDVLNAYSSLSKRADVNKDKIGMWGHSMGGNIIQRALVINPDIKAAVVWGGVVGSYNDMFAFWWNRRSPQPQSSSGVMGRTNSRQAFTSRYGSPSAESPFWQQIDPAFYIADIKTPIQIHHGLTDETVPWQLGEQFKKLLEQNQKTVEYFTYPGADHDISSPSFEVAMQRSVAFFDKFLKS